MGKFENVEYRKILIVEDDENVRGELSDYFSRKNIVVASDTLLSARKAVQSNTFDVVILDVILPDGSGLELCEELKDVPVVILSDLGSDSNIIDGFTAGATDYVTKPVSPRVLEARISLRLLPKAQAKISAHGLTLDRSMRTVSFKGSSITLTSSEFNILAFLMENAGIFFTAMEIYEHVWQMPYLNTTTIKVHISNLRKKMLAADARCANLLLQEFSKGYAFLNE